MATVETDQLGSLLRLLKAHPGSEKICGEISAKIDNVMNDYEFFVDSWPDVKAVVSRSHPKRAEFKFAKHCVNVFATDAEALKTLLRNDDVIDWKRKILFSSVTPNILVAITNVVREHTLPMVLDEICQLLKIKPDKLTPRAIPEGLRLASLEPNQANLVNMDWKFSNGDVSELYIKHLIERRPSCCLYDNDGDVLGYALTYHYGCVGILHIPEKHRGNGYDILLLSHLTDKCLKSGIDPFVMVESWNNQELKLYQDVGFEVVPDLSLQWIKCNYR